MTQHLNSNKRLVHSLPLIVSLLTFCPSFRGYCGELCFIYSFIPADSGVSSTMQLDDINNQQNGSYQSLPESISTSQMVYSPAAQADPQMHQGPYQQLTAQTSHENYTQTSPQLHPGAYPQTTGQLHPGAFQQPAAQLHQGPYSCQTVSTHHQISTAD